MAFTPYSWSTYPGNGTSVSFVVPFPYAKREHVRVFIGWDPSTQSFSTELQHGTDFTWVSGTGITVATAPAAGTTISLVRETPIDEQLAEWQAGSPPTSFELNTADRQVLYALQEFVDRTLQARDDLDEAVLQGAGVTLVDNLNSALTTAALTANQGRVLRLLIEAVEAATDAAQADANSAQTAADAAQADANSAQTAADAALSRAGGTMTGKITLDGPPSQDLHAASKKYVDEQQGLDAFVNFTVQGMVINGSRNVSSVVRQGVGQYRINFVTPFPDTGYAWVGSAKGTPTANCWLVQLWTEQKTQSFIDIAVLNTPISLADPLEMSFMAFG